MTTKGRVIGYARVSTEKQDAERQKLDIMDYCKKQGLALSGVENETISSRKTDRAIYPLIAGMKKGDVLVVTELSRLARSMIELNGIIADAIKRGISLQVVTGQKIDETIGSQALVFALGLSAQVEREMISERTRSALKARKADGVILGRPKGTGRKVEDALKERDISVPMLTRLIESGSSLNSISILLGVDPRTVNEWKKAKGLKVRRETAKG